jgi:uncharacterized RDD family membrane protein YckC
MTEWYFADGAQRQGPLPAEDLRLRFQRGEINLTTLVWREGFDQWKALGDVTEELQLQNLTNATENLGSGFDLRGDYTAIENGTAPLPGTGGGTYSPYSAPASTGAYAGAGVVHGGEVVYAGFWKRYAAYFIDYVVLTLCGAVIGGIVGAIFGLAIGAMAGADAGSSTSDIVGGLLGIVISLVYYAEFHASAGGATLGKMAVGIKVVRSDGQRLTRGRAVGRYFATFVSTLTLMIGYLMAAFTERKQALHDLMCDTVVVDKWAFTENAHLQNRELGTVTIVILVLAGLSTLALIIAAVAMIGVLAAMA